MKKAWNISGNVFEAGYLVVRVAPVLGTPQNEKDWRELQRLMRGLAKVERGWEWQVDRRSLCQDLIFPQTAFFSWQRETTYDTTRKAYTPGPKAYASIPRDELFESATVRMFDSELVQSLRGFRIAALNGCLDVYCAGKPWQRPNKSGRLPTVDDVHGSIAQREIVPFELGLPGARRKSQRKRKS